METNNNNSATMLNFSGNLLQAKSMALVLSHEDIHPHIIVDQCLQELISGLKLNVYDIPFYIMALEVLHTSLSTHISETDEILLNKLRSSSQVITTHHTEVKGGNKDE